MPNIKHTERKQREPDEPKPSTSTSVPEEPSGAVEAGEFACPLCDTGYKHRTSRNRHMGIIHRVDCEGKPLTDEQVAVFQRRSTKSRTRIPAPIKRSRSPSPTAGAIGEPTLAKSKAKTKRVDAQKTVEPSEPSGASDALPPVNDDVVNDLLLSSTSEDEEVVVLNSSPSTAPATVSRSPDNLSSSSSTPLQDEEPLLPMADTVPKAAPVQLEPATALVCLAVSTRAAGVVTRSRSSSPVKVDPPSKPYEKPPATKRHRTSTKNTQLPKPSKPSEPAPLPAKSTTSSAGSSKSSQQKSKPLTISIPPERPASSTSSVYKEGKPSAGFDPFIRQPTRPSPVVTPAVRPALSLNDLSPLQSSAWSVPRAAGSVLYQAVRDNPTESVEQIGARLAVTYRWSTEERRQNTLRLADFREAADFAACDLKIYTPTDRNNAEEMSSLFGYISRVVNVARSHRP
jgi:hypothetical protein